MTKRLSLAVAVLSCAARVFAVELEGPGKTPAPTPIPLAPAGLNPIVPNTDALKTPVTLDASALPQVPASITAGASAANTDATASPTPLHARYYAASATPSPVKAQTPASSAKTAAASITSISEHVAKSAEAAGKAKASGETQSGSGREIETALTGERQAPSDDYVSVYLRGVQDGSIPTGPRLEPTGKNQYRVRTPYNVLYGVREQMVNPGDVYNEAYYAASYAARKARLSERLLFAEVTGSLPLRDGDHSHFTFYPAGPTASRAAIYVDFKRGPATAHGDFDVRTSIFQNAPPAEMKLWGEFSDPAKYPSVAKSFEYGPQSALDAARRKVPSFAPTGASFTARLEKDEATGAVDVWYTLYDARGAVVAVNARDLEVRKVAAAPAKKTSWAAAAWSRLMARLRKPAPLSEIKDPPAVREDGSTGASRDGRTEKFKPGSRVGAVASLTAGALGAWFVIVYGLSRDLAFSLETLAPLGVLLGAGLVFDLFANWDRKK